MEFEFAYGKSGLRVELSDNYNIDLIEPRWLDGIQNPDVLVTTALRSPQGSKPLKDLAKRNDRIAIIFSDITRATPYNIILPPLLEELSHIPKRNIRFFCSNGTHRLLTNKELNDILGNNVTSSYEIIQNQATKNEFYQYVGTTAAGNKILLHKEVLKSDVKILTGFIEPHFFAGFSGGAKALVPGMAYIDTIKYNHSISNLSQKGVNWGKTYGNPLWEDIMEAAEFVPGLFLLNITLNKRKEVTNVFTGNLRTAHKEGCNFVKDHAMVPVENPYDIVITSNSGYPLDLNVYQTVKGMSAAAQILKIGGQIIMAAECWDGIPSNSDYEAILTSVKNPNELMSYIKENEGLLKDTWQIYYQALIQQKADIFLFSDKLDNKTIEKTLFKPVKNIGMLVDELVTKIGPQAKICILPEGPQTIPYIQ